MVDTIGSDCSMLPSGGMGSLHSMSMESALTAAEHNPLLTSFATDAKNAGLMSKLDSMKQYTIFAPSNSSFAKLSSSEVTMMMHSPADLRKILEYGVVEGHVTPAQFARGATVKTLEGGSLELSKMGSVYEVNKAHVECGDVQTENATVYIIDAVIEPMH